MAVKRTLNMIRNISNWDEYLLYKVTGKKKENFLFKTRKGFSVTVPRKIIREFKESFFEEIYLKHLPKSLFSKNEVIVIDIGANVGFFTLLTALKFDHPRIIAFEPIKRNFAILQTNTKAIQNGQVTLVNKAVSNVNGNITLKFNSNQAITTSASIFDNQYGSDEEVVASTTLADIFQEYKLDRIDLLKVDCEGAEYEILYNAPVELFKRINCIALEIHEGSGEKENASAIATYLRNLGYTLKVKSGTLSIIWAYKEPSQ